MTGNKIDLINSRKEGISFYENHLPEEMVMQLRKYENMEENDARRFIEGVINCRIEAKSFYKSNLPEDMASEIESRTGINELDCLKELMKAYSEYSASCNGTLKKRNGEII